MNQSQPDHWARLGPEVPVDLSGRRVLDVGPGAGSDQTSIELAARDAAALECWDPAEDSASVAPGAFDLVVCRDALQRTPHPAPLLGRVWEAMAPGGTLLLGSAVMTEVRQSRYARFVGASAGTGAAEWLPGRLALRWSVETSGFDVDRWIGEGDEADPFAYLAATRTARYPSLVLATPSPIEEVPDAPGQD